MYKSGTASLVNASRVVDLLLKQYGPERVKGVERLSEAAFRVRLYGGGMAHAFVEPDGSLRIPELEEVC